MSGRMKIFMWSGLILSNNSFSSVFELEFRWLPHTGPNILLARVGGLDYYEFLHTPLTGLLEHVCLIRMFICGLNTTVLNHVYQQPSRELSRALDCRGREIAVFSSTSSPHWDLDFFCGDIWKPRSVPVQSRLETAVALNSTVCKLNKKAPRISKRLRVSFSLRAELCLRQYGGLFQHLL
jgi:hypothetical protein